LPGIEPHPIAVLAGFASHQIALACHYAPNLAVSADHVAPLRIDSWIAVGHDHLHRTSLRPATKSCLAALRLVRGRIARRKRVFRGLIDCPIFGVTNLVFGVEPIIDRRTRSIAT
jgi:hypothetical protein